MFYGTLNADSMQRIKNIENGIRLCYPSYQVENYVYDLTGGVHALKVSKNGIDINLYLFYPSYPSGKIESIALYGDCLQGHYKAMKQSMMCFGMPISEISMESGLSDFIDIFLNY